MCGDVESNPGPCSDKRVRVFYSNIRGHGNLEELAVAGSDYDVDDDAGSDYAAISHSSVSLALVAPNRGCGTPLLVPRVWLFMLGKDSAPSG